MAEVIKYLNHRVNGASIPYPIGTEPRFVNSILNSGARNLEEQLLLGNNCTIITSIDEAKSIYTVTKTFGSGEEYFKLVDEYTIHNSNLLLYIVIDERDGNYQIKTANSSEISSEYSNNEITFADNGVYTLSGLNLTNNTEFNILTEKLYLSNNDSNSLISTKIIKGKINGNTFTTNITIL